MEEQIWKYTQRHELNVFFKMIFALNRIEFEFANGQWVMGCSHIAYKSIISLSKND